MRGQLAALRDLGAFPPTPISTPCSRDLELDQPVKDPTQMSADELVNELQDLVKKLLGYGARAPKDLMLFVKNLMFLNAATATLAPDLDLLGEIAHIHAYFTEVHGERIVREHRARLHGTTDRHRRGEGVVPGAARGRPAHVPRAPGTPPHDPQPDGRGALRFAIPRPPSARSRLRFRRSSRTRP